MPAWSAAVQRGPRPFVCDTVARNTFIASTGRPWSADHDLHLGYEPINHICQAAIHLKAKHRLKDFEEGDKSLDSAHLVHQDRIYWLDTFHSSKSAWLVHTRIRVWTPSRRRESTAWCCEIGSLTSLDAPELHALVTSENQFHCTRLYKPGAHLQSSCLSVHLILMKEDKTSTGDVFVLSY